MITKNWFRDILNRFYSDPEFIAEAILLDRHEYMWMKIKFGHMWE